VRPGAGVEAVVVAAGLGAEAGGGVGAMAASPARNAKVLVWAVGPTRAAVGLVDGPAPTSSAAEVVDEASAAAAVVAGVFIFAASVWAKLSLGALAESGWAEPLAAA